MIVCSCHVLSDRDVLDIIHTGGSARTAMQIYRGLGCVPECGRCARTIRRIIGQAADRDRPAER
jgi:bacterioferritin-associated ferredoxin